MRVLELLEHGMADGQKASTASPSVSSSGLKASTARPLVLRWQSKSIQLQDHTYQVVCVNEHNGAVCS